VSLDSPEEESGGAGMERWLLTYADMITLLMAFFIMMYAMSTVSLDKFSKAASSLRAEFGPSGPGEGAGGGGGLLPYLRPRGTLGGLPALDEDLQSVKDQIEEYVEENDLEGLIHTTHETRGLIITLASDNLLFDVGEAQVRAPALTILDRVAGLLRDLPNLIVIEGHTCSLPISTGRFPSNWELSAARACAVVRYLTDRWAIQPERLAATGYASSRPVAPNTTEDARALNRRVEIVILPASKPPAAPEAEPPADPEFAPLDPTAAPYHDPPDLPRGGAP